MEKDNNVQLLKRVLANRRVDSSTYQAWVAGEIMAQLMGTFFSLESDPIAKGSDLMAEMACDAADALLHELARREMQAGQAADKARRMPLEPQGRQPTITEGPKAGPRLHDQGDGQEGGGQ